jgi:hypothetical protein
VGALSKAVGYRCVLSDRHFDCHSACSEQLAGLLIKSA